MNLHDPIGILKISSTLLLELRKLGISTIYDLLFYFPFRHEDFSHIAKISDIQSGQQVSIKAVIKDIKARPGFGRHVGRAEAVVSDDSGSLKVVWFNQSYLASSLRKGDEIFLAGTAQPYKAAHVQLINPIYEKISANSKEQIHTARIIPIYRLTANLPLRSLRTLIFQALKCAGQIKETLPSGIVSDLQLSDLAQTVRNLHFPESVVDLEKARQRMAFEEIFTVYLAVQKHKLNLKRQKAPAIPFNKSLIQNFVNNLPFALTADQKKAIWDILQDLEKDYPMNRLLEGDVGSGKTLVAFTAALEVLDKNLQAILLCPTEILAKQHYQNALKYFKAYRQTSAILLTSKTSEINGASASKIATAAAIAEGQAQFIISTHAALEQAITFPSLALMIIDEQHRFGVRQRAGLKEKQRQFQPHLLSMSATPIPRSLKLTLFGDLEISQIRAMPAGRKPIITVLVPPDARKKAYEFIREQILAGRQIFVVTPLIEENDNLGVKAAESEQRDLQKIFKEFKVALLHGKLKTEQKEQAMRQFLEKQSQILVSTSIIEVGVDIPNAAVIVIEGAERFGLAQLHQFRGRVGRSEHQSYCLLLSQSLNEKAQQRLVKFSKTMSGFELAELDLQSRGFGNIFGEEQSGFYHFNFFDYADHKNLSQQASESARNILAADPELNNYPLLKEKIRNKLIHLE